MKKIIFIFMLTNGLIGLSFAQEVLPDNATPLYKYRHVRIYSLENARLNIERDSTADSDDELGSYSGTLELSVKVQGNICKNDPKTLGFLVDHQIKASRSPFYPSISKIIFLTGREYSLNEPLCPTSIVYRVIKVSLNVFLPKLKGEKISMIYELPSEAFFEKTFKIHIYEENDELKLSY